MSIIRRKILIVILTLFVCFSVAPNALSASTPKTEKAYFTEAIGPRAHVLEWRYKFASGKMYRRLFNCTTAEWIGEWTLCS